MKIEIAFSSSPSRRPADLLVSGFFEKDKISHELERLEPEFSKQAKTALGKGRFEGKHSQHFSSFNPSFREASEAVLIGLGQKKNYREICFRKIAAQIVGIAKTRKARKVRVLLESFSGGGVSLAQAAYHLAETSRLAMYDFDKYKKKNEKDAPKTKLEALEILLTKRQLEVAVKKAVSQAEAIAEGTLLARNLINEPANVMTAPKLAALARELAVKKKISCKVLGTEELKKLKMGGILGVNQGSVTPPALIILEYGNRYRSKGTVCLVGKGVTFDTGGISIKPAKDMEKMKYDMSGAAAVIAAMGVVADLGIHLHVVGLAPAVENNVAENPQRPGDIITMSNGKTVEVINTDAEGRLILGDALAYTERYKPKAIIDLATLTGMCAYTFGDKAIGLMGNNAKLIDRIKKAGEATGERCWELPMWDDYRDQIRGHHSDLLNVGGAYGGTITAAKFLEEFVPEKTAWAHLDIAGTAWCDSSRFDCTKGATGVGVKLLAKLLSDMQ